MIEYKNCKNEILKEKINTGKVQYDILKDELKNKDILIEDSRKKIIDMGKEDIY